MASASPLPQITTSDEKDVHESIPEAETASLTTTSADKATPGPLPQITSSDEKDVPESTPEAETASLTTTSADKATPGPLPQITTSDEKAVPESTTADETVSLTSTTADNYETSESISGDGTSVDEKGGSEGSTQEEAEEEEEEECGFCLFMKAGPCGEQFKQWQGCVEGAEKSEKDIVEQCAQMTTLLKVCMEGNPQYYGPVLDAEKAMQADIDAAEETSMVGSKSSEPPAGEGVDSENGEPTVETVETGFDGSKSGEPPAGKGVESENAEQTVETVETLDVVVNDEGQVVEAVDVVEVEVRAL